MRNFRDLLIELDDSKEILGYVSGRTPKEAWDNCDSGYWMVFIAEKMGVDPKIIADLLVDRIDSIGHLVTHPSSIAALDAVRDFSRGAKPSIEPIDAQWLALEARQWATSAHMAAEDGDYCLDASRQLGAASAVLQAAVYINSVSDAAATAVDYVIGASAEIDGYDPKVIIDAARNADLECANLCRKKIPFEMLGLGDYC